MIPVENISSSTMGNLLYYVAIVGLCSDCGTVVGSSYTDPVKGSSVTESFHPRLFAGRTDRLGSWPIRTRSNPPRYDIFNRDIANSHDYRGICLYASWR